MKTILMCVLAISLLSACGVKPGNVKPPEGARDIYPHSYPRQTPDDQ